MKPKSNAIKEESINDINFKILKKQFPHAVSADEIFKPHKILKYCLK